MKNFPFSSEILPPLSEFFCVCIFAWENLSIYSSQYVLQGLPQERGIPPVPTSVSPSDSFVLMNQMSPSYWFLISNLFYDITTKRQWRRQDIPKQASLLSWSQYQPPADIRRVCFVDMCPGRKWHNVVFSYSIREIHNGGFPASSLLVAELSLKIRGAEDL